jgi:serine/threonine-protein kinase
MSHAEPPAEKLKPGDVVGGFRVVEPLASRGGFAVIFRGEEADTGRPVIVKSMRDGLDELEQSMFNNEAQFLGELAGHPSVVELLHHGYKGGTPFMVVEFLSTELIARLPYLKPLPLEQSKEILGDVLEGLSAIHQRSIVHHDVRPDNVLRGDAGRWKLIDLGVAHRIGEPSEEKVFGEKHFMSPEVIQGERNDLRSDLYSAGVLYYLMLTGRTPFGVWRDRLTDVRGQHFNLAVMPPEAAWTTSPIAPEAAQIALKLLEKDPSDRYQSADEALHDLANLP